MKQMSNWQKTVTVPTLLLSALTAFVLPSTAATTAITQEIQPQKITSFQNEGVYQLAQGSDKCREVAARNGLYVREDPTVYSRALGILPYGRMSPLLRARAQILLVGILAQSGCRFQLPCKVMYMRVFSRTVLDYQSVLS